MYERNLFDFGEELKLGKHTNSILEMRHPKQLRRTTDTFDVKLHFLSISYEYVKNVTRPCTISTIQRHCAQASQDPLFPSRLAHKRIKVKSERQGEVLERRKRLADASVLGSG